MILDDVLENWGDLRTQKKRQVLQTVINFIDFDESDTDDLLYALIETARDYESDDYFGTEGLKI